MTLTTTEEGQRARYLNKLAEEWHGQIFTVDPPGVRPPPTPPSVEPEDHHSAWPGSDYPLIVGSVHGLAEKVSLTARQAG